MTRFGQALLFDAILSVALFTFFLASVLYVSSFPSTPNPTPCAAALSALIANNTISTFVSTRNTSFLNHSLSSLPSPHRYGISLTLVHLNLTYVENHSFSISPSESVVAVRTTTFVPPYFVNVTLYCT